MRNKGQINVVIMFFLFIATLLIVGVLLAVGGAFTDFFMDEITPSLSDIGVIDGTNYSQAVGYGLNPINSFVNQYTWLGGVFYLIGISALFLVAFLFRATQERWMIPLFISLVLLVIMLSLFISNIYEDFYDDNDTDIFGERLRDQTLLSYMILYSPIVMTFVSFIAGVLLFGGMRDEI